MQTLMDILSSYTPRDNNALPRGIFWNLVNSIILNKNWCSEPNLHLGANLAIAHCFKQILSDKTLIYLYGDKFSNLSLF